MGQPGTAMGADSIRRAITEYVADGNQEMSHHEIGSELGEKVLGPRISVAGTGGLR